MIRNKTYLLFVITLFVMCLTSCGFSTGNSDEYANSINASLITALNNKDPDLLKSILTKRTQNIEDLDNQISQLYEFVNLDSSEIRDENILRSTCMFRHSVDEGNRGYKEYDYLRCDLRIKLDNGRQYYFFTHTYRTNRNEGSVGVYKIVCYDVSDYVFKDEDVTFDTKGLDYVCVGEYIE